MGLKQLRPPNTSWVHQEPVKRRNIKMEQEEKKMVSSEEGKQKCFVVRVIRPLCVRSAASYVFIIERRTGGYDGASCPGDLVMARAEKTLSPYFYDNDSYGKKEPRRFCFCFGVNFIVSVKKTFVSFCFSSTVWSLVVFFFVSIIFVSFLIQHN